VLRLAGFLLLFAVAFLAIVLSDVLGFERSTHGRMSVSRCAINSSFDVVKTGAAPDTRRGPRQLRAD